MPLISSSFSLFFLEFFALFDIVIVIVIITSEHHPHHALFTLSSTSLFSPLSNSITPFLASTESGSKSKTETETVGEFGEDEESAISGRTI